MSFLEQHCIKTKVWAFIFNCTNCHIESILICAVACIYNVVINPCLKSTPFARCLLFKMDSAQSSSNKCKNYIPGTQNFLTAH